MKHWIVILGVIAPAVAPAAEMAATRDAVIDLSDDWTPYLFREITDSTGNILPNRYRSVFLGLANDSGDGDGQPLLPGQHNYLELYGIPPTLSVLRARFVEDGGRDACAAVDATKIKAVPWIPTRIGPAAAQYAGKMAATRRRLEAERRKAKLETLDALGEAQPKWAKDIAEVTAYFAQRDAFIEVEKRLKCEKMFVGPERHTPLQFDEAMRLAVIRFQQKHKLYDSAALKRDTMAALSRSLLENDHAALVRVLTERVVAAADILEDGSADGKDGPATFQGANGQRLPVRNLVDESVQAALTQLGLDTPAAAAAFFAAHPAADFKSLRVPVKLPAPPEYYSANMDLSVIIDRGDVFYDPLFDDDGKPNNQTRHHFPMFVLRVKYNGQNIPLVRWRTTIGGWRSDLASNGYEYYRYKGSDIGPRVWRNVVAGPVWIAPNSTPIRTLVKGKTILKQRQLVVNYDEVGPGFLSAYGLVAAYNVVPGKNGRPDWDNGVRVHGSSEILSIRNPDAYSHGCHRLMNHLAERMFSFVLQHRPVVIEGDKALDFARQFLWREEVFEMRLPSRGFWFRLEPPLPVNVLEGNILGKTKKPITGYVPKPGVKYPPGPLPIPPDSPESRAGGGE